MSEIHMRIYDVDGDQPPRDVTMSREEYYQKLLDMNGLDHSTIVEETPDAPEPPPGQS
jgi:hypothetical protein